ncbi:hypothetical protein BKA69DRAFT_944534 [Paraphysoderma sedebokerense]|nr:hypothetical protein BKA69DRAFT_944534 [Paraphysoderma sedebokerense]
MLFRPFGSRQCAAISRFDPIVLFLSSDVGKRQKINKLDLECKNSIAYSFSMYNIPSIHCNNVIANIHFLQRVNLSIQSRSYRWVTTVALAGRVIRWIT